MNSKWIVGILAAVIIIGGGILISKNQSVEKDAATEKERITREETAMEKKDVEVIEKKNENAMEKARDIAMEKKEDAMKKDGGAIMEKKPGMYKDYSTQALTEASQDGGKTVLFFHANWCPFCKTANEAFTSRANDIQAGITVLKTDYDAEKTLKTKYGITYQHTFVQVDADGNLIAKWNGGDIDALKANIK